MLRRLSGRERTVVVAGAAISAVAVLATFVVLPLVDRWMEREARIELQTDQLARLEAVLAEESGIRADLTTLERQEAVAGRRLLSGGTPAVAGSTLQLLLNRYVAESGMELQRVDAVRAAGGDGPLLVIPAQISVRGDIRGLADLLLRLDRSEILLSVDELRIGLASGVRGQPDLLSATVGLHGYALSPESVR